VACIERRPLSARHGGGHADARYAVVDDSTGTWRAEFRTVVYDWDDAATMADANGRPDVAVALRTGRVGRG
jgi:hypothetical protein